MSAQPGGLCMSQCEHWRIHLFRFPVPRKGKRNASESLRLHQNRIAVLTKSAILFFS